MSRNRMIASAALGVCLAVAAVAGPTTAGAVALAPEASSLPTLPQVPAAQTGAAWLASQINSSGYVVTSGQPDLTATANVVLALASVGTQSSVAHRGVTYLESHVNAYVKVDGSDGPGQLALLILDAHALGISPTAFGTTDLVSRLLATERTSGADKGLFGVQDPAYDGAYRQGLALAALAGAGVTGSALVRSAESWLEGQQCPDGGWTSFISTSNPCSGNPADYEGPDTNSTALAVQGLSAQGVLDKTAAAKASVFIRKAEDANAGWGYEPNTASTPGTTDPDSTALVIQAILALGQSPTAVAFDKGHANPASSLVSFRIASGTGTGSFRFPGSSSPNLLSTYQAVPAVAAVKLPFNLAVTTSALPKGSAGVAYSATLAARGGNGAHHWVIYSGSLPAGLTLKSPSGLISGKPTKTQTSTFTVEVIDTKTATSPKTQNVAWKVLTIST